MKYISLTILILSLTFIACDDSLDADEYKRTVRFYMNGELVESTNGQGTHYLNRQNGTNVHSWEFHTNGTPPLLVVARDDAKRELQDKYEYPNVTARLLKQNSDSNGVITPIWYESVSGSLSIDKFAKFTRDGSFEFVLVNEELMDTLYITSGSYSLSNEDEPTIRQ